MNALWSRFLGKSKDGADDDLEAYAALRDAAYRQIFEGDASSGFSEPIPTPPGPVDVLVFEPSPGGSLLLIEPAPLRGRPVSEPPRAVREWVTLATAGMSSARMPLPEGAPRELARIELLWHLSPRAVASQPDLAHFCADVLLSNAHYPFFNDVFYAAGDVIGVHAAQGPVRFLGDEDVAGLLLAGVPPALAESRLPELLRLSGDPVRFLVPIPIYPSELAYAREHGAAALLDRGDLPCVYGGPRAPIV